MIKILLVCSAGMSTSLLVDNMNTVAAEKGIEAKIIAVAEADVKNYLDDVDVLLLGPQVRYLLSKFKEDLEPKGISVDVVNSIDYGTMNGTKVLDHALSMIENT